MKFYGLDLTVRGGFLRGRAPIAAETRSGLCLIAYGWRRHVNLRRSQVTLTGTLLGRRNSSCAYFAAKIVGRFIRLLGFPVIKKPGAPHLSSFRTWSRVTLSLLLRFSQYPGAIPKRRRMNCRRHFLSSGLILARRSIAFGQAWSCI